MRKTAFLVTVSALLLADGFAAEPRTALETCRAVADDTERLACYDAMALPPRAEPASAAQPAPPTEAARGASVAAASVADPGASAPAQAETTDAEANFGLEYSTQHAPERLTSTVAGVQKDARGGLVVELANDQVWQQTDGERLLIEVGDPVIIRRGAMTAFYLSTSENGRRYRFARIR